MLSVSWLQQSICDVCVCLALIVFTDGRYIGSVLDRNGLRPSRFYVSKSNFMYMASEVGVANVSADEVVQKGRLKPGRLLLIDTKSGVFVKDEIIKEEIAMLRPVASWIEQEVLPLSLFIIIITTITIVIICFVSSYIYDHQTLQLFRVLGHVKNFSE